MLPVFLALSTAILSALHNVLIKKGLRTSNSTTAVITSLVVNMVTLWIVSLFSVPLHYLTTPGIIIFVVVGIFQPGLTRLLTIKGIETLGVAVTDPIRATTPMFGAFMAMLFLGERMTLPILGGTLIIIIGIVILSHRKGAALQVRLRYIMFPILASFLAGLSQVMRKFGLGLVPHPLLAAAVTSTLSFVVVSSYLWIRGTKSDGLRLTKECLPFYLGAGLSISVGMAALYHALTLGDVIVITPITSVGPFFALCFSALFLRDTERVTLKIVLGASMIIGGVLLITLRNGQ